MNTDTKSDGIDTVIITTPRIDTDSITTRIDTDSITTRIDIGRSTLGSIAAVERETHITR